MINISVPNISRVVITGFSGFVSPYLTDYLLEHEKNAKIYGLDILPANSNYPANVNYIQIDLMDRERLKYLFAQIVPDYIIHLASFSSVGDSWKNPNVSFKNNTNIFLNVLEVIRCLNLKVRVLSIGSSEEYGVVCEQALPLTENSPLNPSSPYAVARVAQEHLSLIYAKGFSLDIVCTRSFNHLGPGQSEKFVVSSIGKQFVEIKKGLKTILSLGNVAVVRDFLDVRDVVRAYYLILKYGKCGEVYNVCSGKGISLGEIIGLYSNITSIIPKISTNNDLLRPVENQRVVGSYAKIYELVGWKPEIPLLNSLKDILKYWEKQ